METDKLTRLSLRLKELGQVAVAYSGGVDGTFLLKAAKDALGENTVALPAIRMYYSLD
jgi:pyridinium-3,5-biscarboxylic acid mononucleotide sulfurtransferase